MDPGHPSARHHAIVDAIERHDAAAAHAIMNQHVHGGGERVLEALKAAQFT
jgi:DNA-binding GntR family transcriptional regulator